VKLRRRSTRGRPFRYFFATDIHGSDRCFRKFLAAARVYEADALVLGGDIVGKGIIPVVDCGDALWQVTFQGEDRVLAGAEVDEVEDAIRFCGLYPWRTTEDGNRRLREDQAFADQLFLDLMTSQVSAWCALASDRLPDDIICLVTPGNDDPYAIDAILAQADRVDCPEGQLMQVGPLCVGSLGNTNATPWHTDREYDEVCLASQIDAMLATRDGNGPLLFNFHCPPYNTGLDTVTKLDSELRPVFEQGRPVDIPVGSTAVRDAIAQYRPALGLHGHVHESKAARQLGTTLCLNPGSDYSSGVLAGVLVDVDASGEVLAHVFTTG
jgi:Icc-related predicted phosphoesterase